MKGALTVKIKPAKHALARVWESRGDEPEDQRSFLLPNRQYAITDGPAEPRCGFLSSNNTGLIAHINLGGRLATREPESSSDTKP